MPALFPTTPPPTQPPDWPRPRRLTWRSTLLSLLAAGGLLGSQAALAADCSLFNQTVPGLYTCEVGPGYTSLNYVVTGANGGDVGDLRGGRGAHITGTLSGLTPGQTLYIAVGGDGGSGSTNLVGSGGGGYSAISTGSATTGPLVVAGGGGGEGDFNPSSPLELGGLGGNGGTTNAGGGGAGGAGGAFGPGFAGGVTLAIGGAGGTNTPKPDELGGAGGDLGANGVDGVTTSGGGGAGFGGKGGNGAAPDGEASTLGGLNGGGGGGYGAGGGGGGWGGGGGGAGNDSFFGGGGGGGGSSLFPLGAIAAVSAGTASVSFTLPPPGPTVTAINPTTGPTTGNQPVTITGTALTGATAVTLGGTPCTGVIVGSATSLTCTTGAHAPGTVNVSVTTPAGTGTGASLYTYVSPPTVTAIAPTAGPTAGGQPVTITGTDLTGAGLVTIGGATCTGVVVGSPTSLTCTTGAHAAGLASVVVTTPYGANGANGLYTYVPPPTVTAINPTTGRLTGGQAVIVTGTDLTGATGVTIGGAACALVGVPSATSLTCTTPAHAAGAASVLVTTPYGTNGANALFTYVAAPTVTGIAPNAGPTGGGQSVTITGTDLTGATAVTIGAVPCTGVSVGSPTSLTCTTGEYKTGTGNILVSVSVTTPYGVGTGNSLYTYQWLMPTVTLIDPASGPKTGGTPVRITGTNLNGASQVLFGGSPCTGIVATATLLTCTTGPYPPVSATAMNAVTASSLVDVRIITPGGDLVLQSRFTYLDAVPTSSLPIPTLSGWAQLILVALLFGIAGWYRRTRA
ncbi:IPT/TIG domain-containing protein [uncultured Thiodictyon sp.]|jgi:hypothetical protein|uniref:IPT/TIG domain-containing protein n=1 Tax=uncultured Thiodictyon sp. TaxID=1846217 RepID=UPI0025DABF2D|nr:IPT/TIG domain-containing protein [uncultured Thiodictyon sp.]